MANRDQDKILRLVLGDQLNENHSWFQNRSANVVYVLMEVMQEANYVKHHIQKLAAFFAAMRAFARKLQKMGHRFIYLRLDDPHNRQTFYDNCLWLLKEQNCVRFEYLLPDEYRLDLQLSTMAANLPVSSQCLDTEHFLTGRTDLKQHFHGKKRLLLESFYRHMRKKHDILMHNGKPVGGDWNYDRENRQRYDGRVPLPSPLLFENDVSAIVAMVDRMRVRYFGEIDPQKLIWPVTRDQSLQVLDHFLTHGLPHFGTYEDAMVEKSWSVFHSRLSFALNTKMLHPMEVIQAALDRWENDRESVAIQQVEGFIRQILGWREYMRGIYWNFMPQYASMNFFNHTDSLPHYYWDADTRMNCMKRALKQSLQHAYAHHIQRLMVTGNFALLAGVHPDEADAWYLGVYIDAIEWVEITNTRGMSQFADGGIVATKPYVATANYMHAISDYCARCDYDRTKKHGSGACPFNSLYWDFFARHRSLLKGIPRIGMMYRVWDRMDTGEQTRILGQAKAYKQGIDTL